jgi:hypothetical protein
MKKTSYFSKEVENARYGPKKREINEYFSDKIKSQSDRLLTE